MMTIILYLILGALVGVCAGIFGIGGGMIIVPALIFAFQSLNPEIATHLAIGTSHAIIIFTSINSIYAHHQKGAVLWQFVKYLSIGIVGGCIVGVLFASSLKGVILQKIIGVFAILMALQMFFDIKPKTKTNDPTHKELTIAGSIIGFASAIFGIGGGSLTVPYLNYKNQIMQKAVATSAACGFPIALTSALSFIYTGFNNKNLPEFSFGFIYLPALFGIALLSMPCARIGVNLAHKLNPQQLKKLFAIFLFCIGLKFLLFS